MFLRFILRAGPAASAAHILVVIYAEEALEALTALLGCQRIAAGIAAPTGSTPAIISAGACIVKAV